MKNYKKMLLLFAVGYMSIAVYGDYPRIETIVCSNSDTLAFTAQSTDGCWEGTLAATGMWTMQMHRFGDKILTSSQRHLHMFVQKHLRDHNWGWRFQSQTGSGATYSTTKDSRVLLSLILQS